MNQQGFGILAILFMLPVLFLAALLTYFGFDLVHRQTQTQETCRDHVLRAEKEMADHLSDLLALNPTAEKLRAEEKQLKLKIAASNTNPPLAAYYNQLLTQNIRSQVTLQLKQQQLIRSGEWGAKRILISLKNKLKAKNTSEPHLYIDKKPALAIAGNYSPQTFFDKKQTLLVKWEKEINSVFLKWIPELPRSLHGECSATLKKGENIWSAHLSADRFLSKFRL
jgi:hypothetical protein